MWSLKAKLDPASGRHIAKSEKMLGRKQSIKGESILADYGPEESLNESADIEWVNKVFCLLINFILL